MVGAWAEEKLVAGHIWVDHDGIVFSHLAASSPEGYAVSASYAVYDASLRRFANARTINLGGAAGLLDDPGGGLSRFKRGFASSTSQSWLCGKVLRPRLYVALSQQAGKTGAPDFFPAYRAPESLRPGPCPDRGLNGCRTN
jgi:hypothetical protein